MITHHTLQRAFARHTPQRLPTPANPKQRASVALIFAGPPDALAINMILRASRSSDRWSAQMAFPGGRAEPHDPTPVDVAIRETREEIGLALDHAVALGALDDIPLHHHGDANHGVLTPVAFLLPESTSPPPLTLQPSEVAASFWIELDHLYNPEHATTLDWPIAPGELMTFPGIQFQEEIIWGLSYRVLVSLSERLGLTLPMPDFG